MQHNVQFLLKIWQRAFNHSHEIVVALMVEGSKMNVIALLLTLALVCIAFAFQVAYSAEEVH